MEHVHILGQPKHAMGIIKLVLLGQMVFHNVRDVLLGGRVRVAQNLYRAMRAFVTTVIPTHVSRVLVQPNTKTNLGKPHAKPSVLGIINLATPPRHSVQTAIAMGRRRQTKTHVLAHLQKPVPRPTLHCRLVAQHKHWLHAPLGHAHITKTMLAQLPKIAHQPIVSKIVQG
jgi:hypothetical protein